MRIKDAKTQESPRRAQGLLILPPQNPQSPISRVCVCVCVCVLVFLVGLASLPRFNVYRQVHVQTETQMCNPQKMSFNACDHGLVRVVD